MSEIERSGRNLKSNDSARSTAPSQMPPELRVIFPDSDGTTGSVLMRPSLDRVHKGKLDDGSWDRDQTIHRFLEFLLSQNTSGLEAAMRALTRHGCWSEALAKLRSGPSPNIEMGRSVLSFWSTYGLCSVPKALKEDLVELIDTFKYLLPPYTGPGVTLYRGELESRHLRNVYGISWTPVLEVARMFADRRLPDEGLGVILKIEAAASMIVLAVRDYSEHTLRLGEDEYLIDPRKIEGTVSVVY